MYTKKIRLFFVNQSSIILLVKDVFTWMTACPVTEVR